VLVLDVTNVDGIKASITDAFLKKYLKFGDTLHIISFSDTSHKEEERRIMGNDDFESIKRTIFSLKENNSRQNISAALNFTEQYVNSLTNTRQKKIVLVADGQAVSGARFTKEGMSFEWVKIPGKLREEKDEGKTLTETSAGKTSTKTDTTTKPEPKTQTSTETDTTAKPEPTTQTPTKTDTEQLPPPENTAIKPAKVITPETPSFQLPQIKIKPEPRTVSFSTIAVLILAVVFFLMFIVLFMCRQARGSLNRTFALVSEEKGPHLLSLFVEDQSTSIGRRNMHTISPGESLSLGGGSSDFLIFLFPLPKNVAKIHFDGVYCAFIPQKKQFFPEIISKTIPECIGKIIKIRSKKNYDILIRIVQHEDPFKTLNKLFHSVKLPGK
jgi:hypothetical protein